MYIGVGTEGGGVNNCILKAFVQPTSPLRIILATFAFGVVVDTPNIRYSEYSEYPIHSTLETHR